jgi:predicted transposase/invertase (TIGR01784 family)
LRLCFPIHPPLAQARARPLNTTFLTQSLQRKHADCIWEIPLGGHPGHSVFVLVEFQSSVDPTMAARMNSYAALLHLHLTDTRPRARRWPPLLLPLVIYNGQPRWSAPIRLQEPPALPSWPALAHFQLHSAFHLLDLGHDELPSPESQPDNLALTLLHMEQASLQRHTERVGDLFDILQRQLEHHPQALALRRAFLTFFHAVLIHRGATLTTQRFESLQEAKTMFATFVDASLERGREQGLQEGLSQGRLETALKLLHLKFGASEEQWRPRLETLSADQVQDIILRAAMASSLDELFGAVSGAAR